MAEKITLPSFRNQLWKKVKVENENVKKLLTNISTCNIIELNELIYAGAKLVCDKSGFSRRNPNWNRIKIWMRRTDKETVTTNVITKEGVKGDLSPLTNDWLFREIG